MSFTDDSSHTSSNPPNDFAHTHTPLHERTPLVLSRPLSLLSGKSIWLKQEALQPCGSFKLRGIGAACRAYAAQGKRRFISSSGGNAGIAAAYAGRMLGIPVRVVVPETTTEQARHCIVQEGAELIVQGASWQEANTAALAMMDEESALIHPFDDPFIWAGHATLVDELVDSGVDFDAIVLSVGGGGLLSGVAQGLRRHGLAHIPIVAVETQGADSFAQSLHAEQRIVLEQIRSIATSLGAKQVCAQAFAEGQSHPVQSRVVTDREAVTACLSFLQDHRLLVEPACGAALAVAYQYHAHWLAAYRAPVLIVCGGVTTTVAQLQHFLSQ